MKQGAAEMNNVVWDLLKAVNLKLYRRNDSRLNPDVIIWRTVY